MCLIFERKCKNKSLKNYRRNRSVIFFSETGHVTVPTTAHRKMEYSGHDVRHMSPAQC